MKFAVFLMGLSLAVTACAFDPSAFGYGVGEGISTLAPAINTLPGAIGGDSGSLLALGSYALNAGLAAWATYERRKRKKVENGR